MHIRFEKPVYFVGSSMFSRKNFLGRIFCPLPDNQNAHIYHNLFLQLVYIVKLVGIQVIVIGGTLIIH